jgi:hypothetical protein
MQKNFGCGMSFGNFSEALHVDMNIVRQTTRTVTASQQSLAAFEAIDHRSDKFLTEIDCELFSAIFQGKSGIYLQTFDTPATLRYILQTSYTH